MAFPVTSALSAYTDAAKKLSGLGSVSGAPGTPGAQGLSFAELVENTGRGNLALSRNAEGLSAAGIHGSADLADVVTAVSNAEVALQTVLSIRDRVVSAVQEIMRMPI